MREVNNVKDSAEVISSSILTVATIMHKFYGDESVQVSAKEQGAHWGHVHLHACALHVHTCAAHANLHVLTCSSRCAREPARGVRVGV